VAEFKPSLAINQDILTRYNANRLRVVRQVRYSHQNENSIDLVLFLNGLTVATAELRTDFTQRIGDAIDQYRFDRLPKPKGQAEEPLLSFPRGALVHFAVSNTEVHRKGTGPAISHFIVPVDKLCWSLCLGSRREVVGRSMPMSWLFLFGVFVRFLPSRDASFSSSLIP